MLSVLAVVLLSWLLQYLVIKRWGREMVVEFVEIFPDVCPVCSYHTYLVTHGYDVDLQADAHDCHGKRSVALFGKKPA
jgi:hypothetical protein